MYVLKMPVQKIKKKKGENNDNHIIENSVTRKQIQVASSSAGLKSKLISKLKNRHIRSKL